MLMQSIETKLQKRRRAARASGRSPMTRPTAPSSREAGPVAPRRLRSGTLGAGVLPSASLGRTREQMTPEETLRRHGVPGFDGGSDATGFQLVAKGDEFLHPADAFLGA